MDVNIVGDATFIGGIFFILGYKLFFQPCHGIIFLLKTQKNGINGHALQYACVFLCLKENICMIFKMPK
jgi:uncharacterized membrane protein